MDPASPSRPFVVALAGGSGTGKTTLTRALIARLGPDRCALLDHDSYYRDLAHLPPDERARTNFDHPDSIENELLAEHLRRLRGGAMVHKPRYDFATHTRRRDTEPVLARPIVLVEGILLLAVAELRPCFDLRVYLDTPPDVRALRRLQRDIVERGRTIESVHRQYLESVRPMHEQFVEPSRRHSDLELRWPAATEAWVAQLEEAIDRHVPRRTLATD